MPFTFVQLARLRLAACVRSRTKAAQTWSCSRRCPRLHIRPRRTNAQTFYCLFQRHRFQTYIRTYLPRRSKNNEFALPFHSASSASKFPLLRFEKLIGSDFSANFTNVQVSNMTAPCAKAAKDSPRLQVGDASELANFLMGGRPGHADYRTTTRSKLPSPNGLPTCRFMKTLIRLSDGKLNTQKSILDLRAIRWGKRAPSRPASR